MDEVILRSHPRRRSCEYLVVQPSLSAQHMYISEDLGGAFGTLHFADELSCFGWLKLRQDCADLLLEILQSQGGIHQGHAAFTWQTRLALLRRQVRTCSACALCRLLITSLLMLNNEPQKLRLGEEGLGRKLGRATEQACKRRGSAQRPLATWSPNPSQQAIMSIIGIHIGADRQAS